ncbi:MAG TPA: glycosyltransferase family 4 protein [Candidatus Hydrogenedentes bacterium]|nr:glycosyltransferase family 4 protein [Candidatus Hydrogenedentota bacterium]HRT20573.1 glycosyltransferase family 4 protein [Candidatus Hydrogenedentota bacterium]HRT65222.1 glycosyltransferase family 4 protein [Candidatus Hydrogenedentota bacterium]
MRIAFVDLLFSWPPQGGADADVFHTCAGIQALGHDVHLFAARHVESRERTGFEPAALPFPATRLDFDEAAMNRKRVPARFREAVDAWRPDAVFFTFGYFLKPYVMEALAHYPSIARFYAYEPFCPRDLRRFKDGAPCPYDYLRTPDICRRCALKSLAPEIRSWRFLAWGRDYWAARAFMPGYHARLAAALRNCRAVVVYNEMTRRLFGGFNENVFVVPGGVEVGKYTVCNKPENRPMVALMTGRVEDPVKGLGCLMRAAVRLRRHRDDFEVWVTRPDWPDAPPGFKATGWLAPEALRDLYGRADICIVPSAWDEPFGMAAAEAMAAGRPVCASRVGGLQDIVVDGETGFLFDREDDAGLAECMGRLFDDAALRTRMGAAGRVRAESEYDWPRIVARHYPRILERLAS